MEPPIEDPEVCYYYAKNIIKDRWLEAENTIMRDPERARWYHLYMIDGDPGNIINAISSVVRSWVKRESNIDKLKSLMEPPIKDPEICCNYASKILHERWREAESLIINYPEWACRYASRIIKGPWPEAEEIIGSSHTWGLIYGAMCNGQEYIRHEINIQDINIYTDIDISNL